MKLNTAVDGMLEARDALRRARGVSSLGEHMQKLAQYTSAVDENLAQLKEDYEVKEAELFKKYRSDGLSVNAAQTNIKYDIAKERGEIAKLSKYSSSSWKLISATQTRIKHFLAEAINQV